MFLSLADEQKAKRHMYRYEDKVYKVTVLI